MRRTTVAATIGGAVLLAAGALAQAQGGIAITPGSGPPGTAYEVSVSCGVAPEVKRANTQDGPIQGTIAPYPPEQVVEVSPSVWVVDGEATSTDDSWFATCEGAEVGTARFDAESPHLWFGPRPQLFPGPDYDYTTVEGSDCPAGSSPIVTIAVEGDDVLWLAEPTIDERGDWSTPLPWPVGVRAMTIEASCGDVTYDVLQATTTSTTSTSITSSTTTTSSTSTTMPEGGAGPTPAAPVRGTADYTG
jgi:hypothetical protein